MRSLLTMLGIIIGIASIISIVSTIQGTNKQLEESLLGSRKQCCQCQAVSLRFGVMCLMIIQHRPAAFRCLPNRSVRKCWMYPDVEDISFYNSRDYSYNIFYLENSFTGAVRGIDQHYFQTRWGLKSGREGASWMRIMKISGKLPTWTRMQQIHSSRRRNLSERL